MRKIAIHLGRFPSTISREVKRNSDHAGYLYPGEAHKAAQGRKNKNISKIRKNKEMRDFIVCKLHEKWSPSVIAGSWGKENCMKISKEAIYQWIYNTDDKSMLLRKLLIRSRKKRGLKRKLNNKKIKNRVSIHYRPTNVGERVELGHYECDLIFNKGSQSKNICTLIERVTKHATLIPNGNKSSKTVIGSLIAHIKKSNMLIQSITFDNGSEFADHHVLNDLGIKTYFCDPGSPWQKGSIENLNGIARRFIPFSMCAKEINHKFVNSVNCRLNSIPRAILGYRSPEQVAKETLFANSPRRVG